MIQAGPARPGICSPGDAAGIIEEAAAKLSATNPDLARAFLTNYSVSTGEAVFRRWKELAESILTRHVDGYVQQPGGRSKSPGYPTEWLERVVRERPDQFQLPVDRKSSDTDH